MSPAVKMALSWRGQQNLTDGEQLILGEMNLNNLDVHTYLWNSSVYPIDEKTEELVFDSVKIRITLIIVYTLIFALCFFGNLAVVLVVTLHWRMRSITKFFLGNLAFSNLCVGIFCVYQNLSTYLMETWLLGDFLCKMYHFTNNLSHTASVLILVVICVERYLVLLHPFKYRRILTIQRLRGIILLVWSVSALLCFPRLYYVRTIKIPIQNYDDGQLHAQVICVLRESIYDSKTADMINFVVLFVLPISVITVLYTRIGMFLRESEKLTKEMNPESSLQPPPGDTCSGSLINENISLENPGCNPANPGENPCLKLVNNGHVGGRVGAGGSQVIRGHGKRCCIRHYMNEDKDHFQGTISCTSTSGCAYRDQDHVQKVGQDEEIVPISEMLPEGKTSESEASGTWKFLILSRKHRRRSDRGEEIQAGSGQSRKKQGKDSPEESYSGCGCPVGKSISRKEPRRLPSLNRNTYDSFHTVNSWPGLVQEDPLSSETGPRAVDGDSFSGEEGLPCSGYFTSGDITPTPSIHNFRLSHQSVTIHLIVAPESTIPTSGSCGGGRVLSNDHNDNPRRNLSSEGVNGRFKCGNSSFQSAHCRGWRSSGGPPGGTLQKRKLSRVKKVNSTRPRKIVVRMLVVIVLSFAVCNLPYHVRKLCQNYLSEYNFASDTSHLLTAITHLLMYANCAINPILYAFLSKNFRTSFKDLVNCRWKRSAQKRPSLVA